MGWLRRFFNIPEPHVHTWSKWSDPYKETWDATDFDPLEGTTHLGKVTAIYQKRNCIECNAYDETRIG